MLREVLVETERLGGVRVCSSVCADDRAVKAESLRMLEIAKRMISRHGGDRREEDNSGGASDGTGNSLALKQGVYQRLL